MSLLLIVTTCSFCSMALAMLNIEGPEPKNAIEPVGTMVTFTCVVNIIELPAGTTFFGFAWIVGSAFSTGSHKAVNGSLQIGTRQLVVSQAYTASVSVQCTVRVLVAMTGMIMTLKNNNSAAALTAYGEIIFLHV